MRQRSRSWHERLIIVPALLGLVVVACGGNQTPPRAVSPTPSPSLSESPLAPNTVIASNNVFFPKEMNVAVGTTVTWRNIGTYPHNVVSKDRLFNSHPNCNAGPVETNHTGCMKVGEVFRYAFSKAGTFQYYCYIHAVCDTRGCSGSMVGTITVA